MFIRDANENRKKDVWPKKMKQAYNIVSNLRLNFTNNAKVEDNYKVIKYWFVFFNADAFKHFEQQNRENVAHVDIRQSICKIIMYKSTVRLLLFFFVLFTVQYCSHLIFHYLGEFSRLLMPENSFNNIMPFLLSLSRNAYSFFRLSVLNY